MFAEYIYYNQHPCILFIYKSQMYILYPLQNINVVSTGPKYAPYSSSSWIVSMSHSIVKVDGSELCEPVLLWISICMPTGCAKSSLYSYLHKLVNKAWKKSVPDNGPLWCLGDQSFEKLGELMQENNR